MDDVTLTRAVVKALDKMNADVCISATNNDERMIYVERVKYRGKPGEGKWLKADGRPRDAKKK